MCSITSSGSVILNVSSLQWHIIYGALWKIIVSIHTFMHMVLLVALLWETRMLP